MYCSCCLRTQETVQPSPHKLCLQQSASHQRQQPPKVHVSARGGEKLRLDRDVQRQLVLYFFTWTESVAREFQKGGNHREKFVCETSLKTWVKFLIFGNRLKKKKSIYSNLIRDVKHWYQPTPFQQQIGWAVSDHFCFSLKATSMSLTPTLYSLQGRWVKYEKAARGTSFFLLCFAAHAIIPISNSPQAEHLTVHSLIQIVDSVCPPIWNDSVNFEHVCDLLKKICSNRLKKTDTFANLSANTCNLVTKKSFMSNSVQCAIMILHLRIYSKYERRVPLQSVAFISPIAWMAHQSLSYQMLSREIPRNIFSFISDFIAVCASMWKRKKKVSVEEDLGQVTF